MTGQSLDLVDVVVVGVMDEEAWLVVDEYILLEEVTVAAVPTDTILGREHCCFFIAELFFFNCVGFAG